MLLHLQPDPIIDGDGEFLLSAEVALGGLDGSVTQQQLDLFEVPTGFAAQFRTGVPEVMGSSLPNSVCRA